MALAGAFKEADALFALASVGNANLAAEQAQRLRDALVLVLLALGQARRARRRALQAGPARS
jgi:hypothetical protein